MNIRRPLFLVALIMTVIPLLGWAQEKYVPKDDEQLYGTWVDDASTGRAYKWVINSEAMLVYWRGYEPPYFEDRYVIEKKWRDEQGNTYYQLTSRESFSLGVKRRSLPR